MNNRVVKAGIGYTIGNVLLQGIGVLTLPLFTRLLTTSEYGQYSVFMSYAAILLTLVGCALHTSVRSANLTFPGQLDAYVSSVTLIYCFNLVVLLAFSALASSSVCKFLDLTNSQMALLSVYCFSTSMMNLYNTRLSVEYKVKRYLVLSIISSIGSVLLAVVLMLTVFNSDRLLGRLLGQTGAVVLVSIVAMCSLYKAARPIPSKEFYQFGLKYSGPLIAHGVSQTLLAQFDRIMINTIVGSTQAGIYSFAGSVKTILNVIQNALNTVWATWFFDEMAVGHSETIKRRGKEFGLLVGLLAIGVLGISPEVIKVLGAKAYWEAQYVAIPMALDSYILFIYGIVVQAEYYTKKTIYVLIGTIVAAIINIITNYVFINLYGYLAAAYTTLFSYVCYLIMHLIIARRLVGFHIIAIKQLIIQSLMVFLFGGLCLMTLEMWYFRWLLTILSIVIFAVFLIKYISEDQGVPAKEYVKCLVQNSIIMIRKHYRK